MHACLLHFQSKCILHVKWPMWTIIMKCMPGIPRPSNYFNRVSSKFCIEAAFRCIESMIWSSNNTIVVSILTVDCWGTIDRHNNGNNRVSFQHRMWKMETIDCQNQHNRKHFQHNRGTTAAMNRIPYQHNLDEFHTNTI